MGGPSRPPPRFYQDTASFKKDFGQFKDYEDYQARREKFRVEPNGNYRTGGHTIKEGEQQVVGKDAHTGANVFGAPGEFIWDQTMKRVSDAEIKDWFKTVGSENEAAASKAEVERLKANRVRDQQKAMRDMMITGRPAGKRGTALTSQFPGLGESQGKTLLGS